MTSSPVLAPHRIAEERTCTMRDGTALFYRYWPAAGEPNGRAILLFHRGHEHSGRMAHLVDEFNLPRYAMFAWDARGHGHSGAGNTASPSLGLLVEDVQTFVQHISAEHGIAVEDMSVVAQSVGSVLVAAWVHDYAPRIRCQVLAAPAFKVKLYVPFARPGLAAMHAVAGDFHVNSYVKARYLTHDAERIASFEADPLIKRPIAAKLLLGLYSTAERVVTDAAAIHTPTQLLMSGADWVVHHKPQHQFFANLSSSVKEKHVFENFYHDTLGEKDRHLAVEKARSFIERQFGAPAAVDPLLLHADRQGFTKQEFDTLSKPLPALSPKAINFKLTRFGMETGGRLSAGIRLGLETGFDSGSTLDYVYRNEADGLSPIGKLVDWFYLNSTGWRGIRVRKQNMEAMLAEAMKRLRAEQQPVHIVDIAAGHGRYVLDAIAQLSERPDSILLRDYSDINVKQGSQLIRDRQLESIARFEHGDAFDRESLAAITPRPTLGIVSGLYELFPDNNLIKASLAGLADAVAPGGYLVYTGQPWHPQLEMIARVLPSHRGHQPWVMRRRTQAEMDALVRNAGFEKCEQFADDQGIFTVSLARRQSS